jgi:hypothetical protein
MVFIHKVSVHIFFESDSKTFWFGRWKAFLLKHVEVGLTQLPQRALQLAGRW